MTQPACVPTREPVSDTLPPPARLRLKPSTLTLLRIAGFLGAAVILHLNPLLTGSVLPSRFARCFATAGTFQGRDALAPRNVSRTRVGLCGCVRMGGGPHPQMRRVEGGTASLPRTSRARALGCADVCGWAAARTRGCGTSRAGRPRSQECLAHARWAVRMCADGRQPHPQTRRVEGRMPWLPEWKKAFFAHPFKLPRRRSTRRHP